MVDNNKSAKADIQNKYDKGIRNFNRVIATLDFLGLKKLRKELLGEARGDTLEVAVGTGMNLIHYPADVRLTAMDLSSVMMSYAQRESDRLFMDADFSMMDAEFLAFGDHTFDTVVDSLTLCTFHDPAKALREMARVCKPGGRVLLLEHGRSDNNLFRRYQDWQNPGYSKKTGCSLIREPLELVERAGLKLTANRRTFMGVFHVIIASPS